MLKSLRMASINMNKLFLQAWCMVLVSLVLVKGQQLICENRNPDGYTVSKTEGDGGFQIIIVGPEANKGRYIPNEVYTVTIQGLKTRYSTQKFTEFLLVAESEKQLMMGQTGLMTTGIFHIIDDSQSRFSDFCPDGVTSLNLSPKSEISVLWTAPSVLVASCITFKTTVVERPHIWYMDDRRLTKTLCPQLPSSLKVQPSNSHKQGEGQEDRERDRLPASSSVDHVRRRNASSSSPSYQAERHGMIKGTEVELEKCCACDDAKYEIIFEGLWSKETHPRDFPENEWLLHFSDIIGASHSQDFRFWEVGQVASDGIQQVAEWGATRSLENELKSKSKFINTIIKARGLWHPNEKGKTSAAFRVDKNHHLMSLVSMIGPSPDWIVGLSGIELCLKNCTWMPEAQYDLYPYDAGSDSGVTYMSPNSPTEPRAPIRPITSQDPEDPKSPFYDPIGKQMNPFARVSIRRQRIYPKNCDDNSQPSVDSSHEIVIAENTEEANRPECAVTQWTPWSECSVVCGKGLRMRKRSYELPDKADMMRCDRQLVEKEMCLGAVPTCEHEADGIEEFDTICATSEWSDWSPCSATCGRGVEKRTRAYKNPLGRKKCHSEIVQTRPCTAAKEECDENEQEGNRPQSNSDCALTPWSEWSPCSVTCGQGFRERSRVFLHANEGRIPPKCNVLQRIQRSQCVGEGGPDCSIQRSEAKQICMSPPEPGPCRAYKPRFYFSPEKGMCIPFIYGGCKGNRNSFLDESECMKTCGFVVESPPQTVQTSTTSNFSGDLLLQSESTPNPRSVTSNVPQSTVPAIDNPVIEPENIEDRNPQKVDCSVSEWSTWSPCSVSCGVGFTVRQRTVLTEPQNDGRRCPRKIKKRKRCHMPPC